jgi:hypothetical protein
MIFVFGVPIVAGSFATATEAESLPVDVPER